MLVLRLIIPLLMFVSSIGLMIEPIEDHERLQNVLTVNLQELKGDFDDYYFVV